MGFIKTLIVISFSAFDLLSNSRLSVKLQQ